MVNFMTHTEIQNKLSSVVRVKTEVLGKENIIEEVNSDHVVIKSLETENSRIIPYKDILNAKNVTRNSSIIQSLAKVLGV